MSHVTRFQFMGWVETCCVLVLSRKVVVVEARPSVVIAADNLDKHCMSSRTCLGRLLSSTINALESTCLLFSFKISE